MPSLTVLVAVALVFFVAAHTGEAIRCFACTSQYDVSCGEPFTSASIPYIDCDAKKAAQEGTVYDKCKKITRQDPSGNNNKVIIRDCAARDTSPSGTECIRKVNGDYACYCTKDGCNGGKFPSRG